MTTRNFVVQNGLTVGNLIIDAATASITTDGTISSTSTGTTSFSGDITVAGNLTVNGTQTIINSTTLNVIDKNIVVANNQSTSANVDGSGIDAGGGTPIATWRYNHSTTSWQSNVAITPSANASVNLGATGNWWNNVYGVTFIGVATTAKYADLAEKYMSDADYQPGTVVEFGGTAEITMSSTDASTRVAGVISTNPAYLMNSDAQGLPVALQGRVPCKVMGHISKGDMLVSAGNGHARAEANPIIGSVIGKALENFDGETGVIEVVVGRV